MAKLTSFSRKGSSKNCIIVKIVFSFFPPTSNFLRTHWTETLLFFLIMHISSVPNFFFKSFAFGTFCHKNVIALADVFPIACQWKDISV